MRKFVAFFSVLLLTALVGCVTINVYFPAAAAQKAADQFIGSVIGQGASSSSPSNDGAKSEQGDKPASDGGPSASVLDLLVPAAYAASPNLRIHTPTIDAIHERMRKRFTQSLKALLDDGVIGFTQDGLVQVRSLSAAPLPMRAGVKSVVAAENGDRNRLYAEIAKANGHPEWEKQIRTTFAAQWINRAHPGWYYRDSSGAWKRK